MRSASTPRSTGCKRSTICAEPPPGDALIAVLPALRCPVCADPFRLDARSLRCPAGHSFDRARQGYVNLTVGGAAPHAADTAEMLAARAEFLGRGHYRAVAELVAASVRRSTARGLVVDLAGGTGYYLSAVLDERPDAVGVCVDLSTPALRRAARAHPRMAAVGADVWLPLPLASGSAAAVVNVFGPRNAAEIGRVLSPGGMLVTASPAPEHLQELVAPLGMLSVDPRKAERAAATFADFDQLDTQLLTYSLTLGHDDIAALVGMGPSAVHTSADELAARIRVLPEPTEVTAAIRVSTYVPRTRDSSSTAS